MIHVTTVKELPKRNNEHCMRELSAILNGFMKLETKFGKVEHWRSSYVNINVARSCLYMAIKRRGLPIKVSKINDELYFVRKDM